MQRDKELHLKSNRARVFAITSGKGGVGKTSIAVNLSISLSKAGARVLLIDADMGLANVDLMTGISATRTIEQVLNGQASIFDALTEGPEGLTILPAGSGMGHIQEMGPDGKIQFKKELLKLENAFELIFIDTGAGISANVVDFVFMADEVIVVMTPEPTAFADAYAMVKLVTVQKPDMKIGVIVNMVKNDEEAERIYTKFNEITRRFLERATQNRGSIVRDNAVGQAVLRQIPLALSAQSSPSMKSIRKIAKNIVGINSTNKGRLFNR
ncbi:MinD/ParA family protein [bacterium]|nr:MinD/ParA family protein [bacterium]